MTRHLARSTSILLIAATLATPLSAFAQGADNKVQAEALFEEGRRLMDQKNFAEACKKLEGSQKLDPGAGTLLNLAACYEQNGQTASAWVTYKDAANASAARHPDWAQQASAKASELEPSLSHLTITAPHNLPGLEVKRDGAIVSSASLGAAFPIDGGSHTIEAQATGYKPFATKISIAATKDAQLVAIPPLEAATTSTEAPKSDGGTQRVLGLSLAGAGGVGLVVGTVFGIMALGKKSSASDPSKCSPDFSVCNADGKSLVDAAKSDGFISTVTLIGGAAFATAGIVIFLTAPHGQKTSEGATLQAHLGAPGSPAGFSLGGAF